MPRLKRKRRKSAFQPTRSSMPAFPSSSPNCSARTPASGKKSRPWSRLSPGCLYFIGVPKLLAGGVFLWLGWLPALLVFFSPGLWFLWQLFGTRTKAFAPAFTQFQTERKELWLTIDDGPDPSTTPAILEWLEAHQAKASFFLIGAKAQKHPDLVESIRRRGHTIGNHSFSHRLGAFWRLGPSAVADEIDRCQQVLGEELVPFRSPAGIKNLFLGSLLKERNLPLVLWNRRGYDSILPPSLAFRLLTHRLQPGDILLLHEHRLGKRNELLPHLLAHLKAQGFRCIIPPNSALR